MDTPVVFIRADCFYVITGRRNEDWAKHAELNPGTQRIEDMEGNILWSLQ
jgi:hypothetical protein